MSPIASRQSSSRRTLSWLVPCAALAVTGYMLCAAAAVLRDSHLRSLAPPLAPSSPAAGGLQVLTKSSTPTVAALRDEHEDPSTPNPEEWRDRADYTLRVQKRRLPFPGAAEQGGPREVELLTYNGQLVGPTIRVRRGTTLNIKLINELPEADQPAAQAPLDQADPPHDLYTTNLHTHGLHVSPSGHSDNVFREVPPGASFQYTIKIPADHPSGTFWYHPHNHGSVAYQLGNGMAGALIVEGGPPAGPVPDLDRVPEIAQAKERILVLQQLILRTGKDGVGRADPRDNYAEPDPKAFQVTAVNGGVLPTYTIHPREVQRWRLVSAAREGSTELRWYDDRGQGVNSLHFYEIAVDGLATGKLTPRHSVTMYPGSRRDLLVKGPERPGTYFLVSLEENETPGANEKLIVHYVAKLIVEGADRPMPFPTAGQLAPCKPFASIDPAECQVKRNVVLSYDSKKNLYHINGLSFSDQTAPFQPLLGSAEEWTITAVEPPEGSENEPHPFHIHVNPFELVRIENTRTNVAFDVGEWRDTVAVEPGKKVTIRLRFRDFPGKTVFHCHTLDHEDQGMMSTFEIVDPSGKGAEDEDPTWKLAACRIPTPPLALPAADGSVWDLKAAGQRPVILVFFRGIECVHCVRELRHLLREAAELAGTGTVVVAVSSEPIGDPLEAIKWLPVPAGLDFRLLVDEERLAFRSFDCFRERPQHGLFVIDQAGLIRARYVGETPFADSREVCERVRELIAADRQVVPSSGAP